MSSFSIFSIWQLFSGFGFIARGAVGFVVLLGAYFYSGRKPELRRAALIVGIVFGVLTVLAAVCAVLFGAGVLALPHVFSHLPAAPFQFRFHWSL